jgi:hypothetical protein
MGARRKKFIFFGKIATQSRSPMAALSYSIRKPMDGLQKKNGGSSLQERCGVRQIAQAFPRPGVT